MICNILRNDFENTVGMDVILHQLWLTYSGSDVVQAL